MSDDDMASIKADIVLIKGTDGAAGCAADRHLR